MTLMRTFRTAFLCLAVAAGSASLAAAETPDDQIVVGLSMTNILALDPPAQTGRELLEILSNVYDLLVEIRHRRARQAHARPRRELGRSARTARPSRLKLREGVKFHSGNPLTAEDFVWSLHRALKLDVTQASNWKIYGFSADNAAETITAPDATTVVLKIPQKTDPQLVMSLARAQLRRPW